MHKIIFITVHFKNTIVTTQCVSSINSCTDADDVEIIIVDNESTGQSKLELENIRKNSQAPIKVIPSEINTYYWGGAALGLKQIIFENTDSPDWIIIANNDIIFNKHDFIKQLIQLDPKKYPIIAPKILLKDSGKNQNPCLMNSVSRFQKLFYRLYFLNYKTAKTVHKVGRVIKKILLMNTDYEENNEIDIYAPHGSCVIFSKRFFEMGGYLDDGFTLYGEELSVAEIARELKLRIVYCPQLEVIHNEHSSTSSVEWRNTFNQFKESYYYLKNKHSF